MASPTVETTAVSVNGRFVDDDTVDLPTGLTNGDLIIIGLSYRDEVGSITWPSEWTRIGSATAYAAADLQLDTVYAVVGDGAGEVPSSTTSITVSTVENGGTVYLAWRISGAEDPATQPPERSSVVQDASGADADPPSLTPTGGAKDYLWLAFAADGTGTYTAGPANYSNFIQGREPSGSASDHASAGGAERQLTASSEDPGAFTDDSTVSSLACTIAVHPASAGGTPGSASPGVTGMSASLPAASPTAPATTTPSTTSTGLTIPAVSPAGAASTALSAVTSSVVVAQPSVEGGGSVSPAASALTADLHAVSTATGGTPGSASPSELAAQLLMAQATPVGASNVTPSVLSAALNLPAVTTEGLTLVSPAALETAVSFGQVALVGGATVTVDALELEVVFGVPVSGEATDHPTGKTGVTLDASTTDAGIVASITSVSLDESRTHVSLDKTRTDT